MAKFFVPAAEDPEQAERVYEAIRLFVSAPVQERRIASIRWRHNGQTYSCYVGGHMPEYFQTGTEPVCAIFDAGNLYKICTGNRGVIRGEPVYAGKDAFSEVSYFDE